MGDPKGYLKYKRETAPYRPVCERIMDYGEVTIPHPIEKSKEQASRCMDCGTPFCNWGCPIGNYIPEWNDLMFKGQWKRAYDLLEATNLFPELTGRLCPALCEYSCVLGINDDSVTIRENELAISEQSFKKGYVKPHPPTKRTGKIVAIVGSGPAGLACAAVLNKEGHKVTVFEKDEKIGGILRYGIPNFKLDKKILDRRLGILEKEGIKFVTKTNVGIDYKVSKLKENFDAICLAGGSRVPRDLEIEGRGLSGIHFAMDYLIQSNRLLEGKKIAKEDMINAKGKKVIVIGGGDTGADCVGTANRQGATCVVQIEILPQPPECRTDKMPWPYYPMLLKTSSSHEEGSERQWSISTKKFVGENNHVQRISCVKVNFSQDDEGYPIFREEPNSEFEIEGDLIVLALGFTNPEHHGLIEKLRIALGKRGNVQTDNAYMTSKEGIFCAGDMHRGQSLIVWAITEGMDAAYYINKYLSYK